jgi:hypothetical protein
MGLAIKKYLLLSQLCLLLSVVICLLLLPHFLFSKHEGGMSNYGVHLKTIIPYSLGLLLASFYALRAALAIKIRSSPLRWLLLGYSALLLLVLVTTYPYKLNVYLKDTHIAVSIVLFWFEVLAAIWLCRAFLEDKINISLVILQIVGLIIGGLTLFGVFQLLFTSELLTIIPFGIILLRSSAATAQNKN